MVKYCCFEASTNCDCKMTYNNLIDTCIRWSILFFTNTFHSPKKSPLRSLSDDQQTRKRTKQRYSFVAFSTLLSTLQHQLENALCMFPMNSKIALVPHCAFLCVRFTIVCARRHLTNIADHWLQAFNVFCCCLFAGQEIDRLMARYSPETNALALWTCARYAQNCIQNREAINNPNNMFMRPFLTMYNGRAVK